jgi:hypothetical protein
MDDSTERSITSGIGIRPEVTMLSVLRHLNYKPWFAMAEFIDNAIQSSIANAAALMDEHEDYVLEVKIEIKPTRILITDNAAGISKDDFPRAFRTAQQPANNSGLSEFGMGMKSAACWFAQKWSVRTSALGESIERTVNFDIKKITEERIETLVPQETTASKNSHYTVITLRNLHHAPQGRTIGKIKEHLASIYRVFLTDGRLKIQFGDTNLSYAGAKILVAKPATSSKLTDPQVPTVWKKDISLDFGKGHRVRGFAALRETGSTNYAGFALFRRDRLIEGSHDETYRPIQIFKHTNSFIYQRLFGELHIEGFEVSHTKDGFRWEEYEEIFLEHLKEELEKPPLNLIYQAENYRALPSKVSIHKQAIAATEKVATYVEEEVAPHLVEARSNPTAPSPLAADLPIGILQTSERSLEVDDGDYIWAITLRTSLDPQSEDWLSLAQLDSEDGDLSKVRRLVIDVSLGHPYSVKFLGANYENLEMLLRFGVGISISLLLAQDLTGYPPEGFLSNFNPILRGAMLNTRTVE